MTLKRQSVTTNFERLTTTGLSTRGEEASTVLVLYAAQVPRSGFVVHVYSQDTNVLLLDLPWVPHLGSNAAFIMGSGQCRQRLS